MKLRIWNYETYMKLWNLEYLNHCPPTPWQPSTQTTQNSHAYKTVLRVTVHTERLQLLHTEQTLLLHKKQTLFLPEQGREDGGAVLLSSLCFLHQVVDGDLRQHRLAVRLVGPQGQHWNTTTHRGLTWSWVIWPPFQGLTARTGYLSGNKKVDAEAKWSTFNLHWRLETAVEHHHTWGVNIELSRLNFISRVDS